MDPRQTRRIPIACREAIVAKTLLDKRDKDGKPPQITNDDVRRKLARWHEFDMRLQAAFSASA